MHTLLPCAFSRTSQTFAWIKPADNLMVVDARLRQEGGRSAGPLPQIHRHPAPVVLVVLKNPPEITMTEWLNEGNLPASLHPGTSRVRAAPWSTAASSAASSRI